MNRQLPYLVSNVIELLDSVEDEEEDGANVDLDAQRKGKSAVIKTSTRQVCSLVFECLNDWIRLFFYP